MRLWRGSTAQTTPIARSPLPERSRTVATSLGRAVVNVTSCCPVCDVRISAIRLPSGETPRDGLSG